MRGISLLQIGTLLCALGCGLIGGFLFSFSFVVMRALARLPAAHGIAAMQSINIVVINPWFMTVFVGTAALCAMAIVTALLWWSTPGAAYLLVGGLLYLVGTILVTGLFNVPRNNALAALDPSSAEAARVWTDYVSTWTAWNHVRTAAALVAAALFSLAFRVRG